MSHTNLITADEILGAIAGLLSNYRALNVPPVDAAIAQKVEDVHVDDSHAPWMGLTGFGPVTNMTPSAELAAKMQWLTSNLPGGISMRQLVLDATERHVNELIAKHYKP